MKSDSLPITQRPLMSWSKEGGILLQVAIVVASLLVAGIRVVPIEFQRLIINKAIQNRNLDLLYLYCTGFLISVLLGLGLKYAILFLQNIMGERILMKMRNEFYCHALTLPHTFFLKNRPGSMANPLINYLGPVGDYLGNAWAVPLTNILTLLAMGIYLVRINLLLGLISLCVYPVSLMLLPRIQKLSNRANRRRMELGQKLSGKIVETFSGIEDIQAHAGYATEIRIFSSLTQQLRKARIQWRIMKLGGKITINFFINLSPFLFFLVGGGFAINGHLDMGELVAFLSAQALMFSPWTELMNQIQIQQDASVQYKKVQAFFDEKPAQIASSAPDPPVLTGNFQIRDLSLEVGEGQRILDQINLEVTAGELLALVGRSGSGKSMLLKCLAGKIRNYGGTILADGRDIRQMTSQDLAGSIGVVSQSPYMFEGTIQENLLYPLHALTPEKMPSLDDMILSIQQAGLYPELLLFGLNIPLDKVFLQQIQKDLLAMRPLVKHNLPRDLADHIHYFTNPDETALFFEHTLLENILCGKPRAQDAQAMLAWLPLMVPLLMEHDLLETIVLAGLGHRIGSRGERLSGGQRQRLALAGILLKQSRILILDEVGSGLDSLSRTRLETLYQQLKGDHTLIAVEHNLEHVRHYDRILVMDQGRIVETGTHHALISQRGAYFGMVSATHPGLDPDFRTEKP